MDSCGSAGAVHRAREHQAARFWGEKRDRPGETTILFGNQAPGTEVAFDPHLRVHAGCSYCWVAGPARHWYLSFAEPAVAQVWPPPACVFLFLLFQPHLPPFSPFFILSRKTKSTLILSILSLPMRVKEGVCCCYDTFFCDI